jgi:putative endonuclease
MASYAAGVRAESLAARFLESQGYQLLRQNFRSKRGEIDLIAMEGQTLCFVEVRYRGHASFGHPTSTINRIKQRRIVRTASAFLTNVWTGPPCACRFDVISILGQEASEIVLLRNAFDAPGESY